MQDKKNYSQSEWKHSEEYFDQAVYLTFPMAIFKNGTSDIREDIHRAMEYCLYERTGHKNMGRTPAGAIKAAAESLHINFVHPQESYGRGEKIARGLPAKSPKTSISKKMMFDFYDGTKSEFEIVTFLAFAALRSIIQRDPYKKITNWYLLCRMAGEAKRIDERMPLPMWLVKYSQRYWLDRIKRELELNWGLKLYGYHCRGFYVSFAKDITIDKLAYEAEARKKKTREKLLVEAKKQARQKAVVRIKTEGIIKAQAPQSHLN